jgi:hypothetical protein
LAWIIRGILGAGPSTDVGSDSVFLSHGGLWLWTRFKILQQIWLTKFPGKYLKWWIGT